MSRALGAGALAAAASLGLCDSAHALLCGTVLDPVTVTATAIDFGPYLATDMSPDSADGTVTIKCQSGADFDPSFTVALSAGTSDSFNPRRMAHNGSTLNYNIYTTSGGGVIWGDGASGTVTQSYSNVVLLGNVSFTTFGQISTGQFATPGDYSDTITVTVSF